MPERFPQEVVLRNGTRLLLRLFKAGDTEALYQFFLRLPMDVRRFAWDRIDSRALVERWGLELDYAKVLPILAFDGQKVVADATLHFREGGPLRLVGRIKWLIDPAYRGLGLGTTLVNDFIRIARGSGLRHLTCMLITDLEADAVTTLHDLGFSSYTVPGYGTDPDGNQHDMTKMVLKLKP
ncbi:MAG TPA: GNAT family N-acetyltransferase [Thermoanaerobaculia bacterium]|nr:GNAT family N-acetyltransferase [Thermoanaerobaculia bacterium]